MNLSYYKQIHKIGGFGTTQPFIIANIMVAKQPIATLILTVNADFTLLPAINKFSNAYNKLIIAISKQDTAITVMIMADIYAPNEN